MKTLSSTWFEVKVRYLKEVVEGAKIVREAYIVEAQSFGEAELSIQVALLPYVFAGGDLEVIAEKIAPFKEVLMPEGDEQADNFFKVKVEFITLDDNLKAQRQVLCYLVNADSIEKARTEINNLFKNDSFNYEIVSVSKTPLLDVFNKEE